MEFLRNAWYAGALTSELGSEPMHRRILDKTIVFYRTEAGTPVALEDRCPHRFAPLHKGKVKGDSLECPYHGLRFDPTGQCVFNPHGDHHIPRAAHTRAIPLIERDGLIWIWTGEPELRDASKVLDLSRFFGDEHQARIGGSFVINAHMELVLDNLLDLSHAPFLHPTTLADPANIGLLRFETKQEGDTIWALHHIPNSLPSAQFAPFRTSAAPRCDAHAHMRWDPPCNLQLDVGVTECGHADAEGLYIHMAHLLAPIDANRTRYLWSASRNFAPDDKTSRLMSDNVVRAFTTEDEPMIEAVAANMGTTDLLSLKPVLLPGDAAGIRARRALKTLREKESA